MVGIVSYDAVSFARAAPKMTAEVNMKRLLLAAVACVVASSAPAQTDPGRASEAGRGRRLSFSYNLGNASGGPHGTIVDQMHASGLDKTLHSCFLFGCENDQVYPHTRDHGS